MCEARGTKILYVASSAVAMIGDRPPATTDDSWYPSEAPLQRSRLKALHRLEHRVLDLRQAGSRMSLAPRNQLPCHSFARGLPAR
jgi:hypothetical protein